MQKLVRDLIDSKQVGPFNPSLALWADALKKEALMSQVNVQTPSNEEIRAEFVQHGNQLPIGVVTSRQQFYFNVVGLWISLDDLLKEGCITQSEWQAISEHHKNEGTTLQILPESVTDEGFNEGKVQVSAPTGITKPIAIPIEEQRQEAEIIANGAPAPRLTPEYINSLIVETDFHVFPGSLMTICQITLKNGFTLIGQNACVSKSNWSAEMGKEQSFKQAREKIWELEGYLLKQRLWDLAHSLVDPASVAPAPVEPKSPEIVKVFVSNKDQPDEVWLNKIKGGVEEEVPAPKKEPVPTEYVLLTKEELEQVLEQLTNVNLCCKLRKKELITRMDFHALDRIYEGQGINTFAEFGNAISDHYGIEK